MMRFVLVFLAAAIAGCATQAETEFPEFMAERAIVVDLDGTELCCLTIQDVHDAFAAMGSNIRVRQVGQAYVMNVDGTDEGNLSLFFARYSGGGYWLTQIEANGFRYANAGGLRGYANTNQILISLFPDLRYDEADTARRHALAQKELEEERRPHRCSADAYQYARKHDVSLQEAYDDIGCADLFATRPERPVGAPAPLLQLKKDPNAVLNTGASGGSVTAEQIAAGKAITESLRPVEVRTFPEE